MYDLAQKTRDETSGSGIFREIEHYRRASRSIPLISNGRNLKELLLMKKMKFNTLAGRTITAGLFAGLFLASQAAFACTLGNWSAVSGDVDPGSPAPDAGEVLSPRYSGLCAMAASGQGYVEDVSPGGIDRIRARFYVLADNTSDVVVYEGFNGGTSVFTVGLSTTGLVTFAGSGFSLTENGVSGNWNSIEVDWNSGAGTVSLWVNSDATSAGADDTGSVAANQVTSVRLGSVDAAAGPMSFDAYESRRTTAIGRLLAGDANSDAGLSTGDLVGIRNELLDVSLAAGQPDCNEDGAVSTGDLVCVRNILLGP